jgi:hypothetical protein
VTELLVAVGAVVASVISALIAYIFKLRGDRHRQTAQHEKAHRKVERRTSDAVQKAREEGEEEKARRLLDEDSESDSGYFGDRRLRDKPRR